ncbi:mutator mutT protein [Myxococcus stipitatus DSM 14675]|uniref:Mutator mutT protein n=2 Tax=Myxococcus stipitatus TaxID=83455 RepID=L7U8L4_MYXSD|nr:mutator mutT protein [Myxococcus stipitatus DSM 14675]
MKRRMPYSPIIGTLGYVMSEDRQRVLLIHRVARPDDAHLGKYNGLGGKMERDEDVAACMRREIREEAGIECTRMVLRGTLSWPGFGKQGEDWLGFVFRIDAFEGTPFERNPEGTLSWVPLTELPRLPMWDGDRHFLPLVFDEDPRVFHGVMPYSGGRALSWNYTRL